MSQSQWFDNALVQAESSISAAQAGWMTAYRQQALDELKQQSWPTRKTEAFRFTSLAPLSKFEVTSASFSESAIPVIPGLTSIDIVFQNGQLQTDLAALKLPAGVQIVSLDSQEGQAIAGEQLGRIKPQKHLFGLLNDTLSNTGIALSVSEGVHFETPVRVVHIANQGVTQHSKLFVSLGQNAQATVIEHGLGNETSVNTAFSEYDLATGAELEHYRLALFTDNAIHTGGCHFRLAESANLNSAMVGYGSELSRLDVDVIYQGEHANANIDAIYLLAEGEHFDLQSCIEHAVPNCTTEENVRGIVGDNAKANFNGRIHIHRYAQKTLAELNNRNLLLSRRGQINTKPELEIYADDVKCAHGATVAEIEESALYYLLSRGIPRSQALVMLNFGFIQELINNIRLSPIREWLHTTLKDRFAHMEVK